MEKEKSLSLFSADTLDSIAMAEVMGGIIRRNEKCNGCTTIKGICPVTTTKGTCPVSTEVETHVAACGGGTVDVDGKCGGAFAVACSGSGTPKLTPGQPGLCLTPCPILVLP